MAVENKAQYRLENICGDGCPCHFKDHYTHLNLVRKSMDDERQDINSLPERKHINVRGRQEHEAIIKDASWCKELGLDQQYETMVYLKRWGDWLSE